jgi:predicted dehydrogenase
MTEPLRLGFIGGGLNSAVGRVHALASQLDGRWHLEAGCFSKDPDMNLRTARERGVSPARTHGTLEEFIELEVDRLDAVAVLTPTPQHFAEIDKLLRAGFNVISEKSLAVTSQEAVVLADLARAENRFLAVTFNYSGYPMVRELRSRIRNGELGRIVAIHVEMPQEGFLRVDDSGNFMLPQAWRRADLAVPTVSLDLGTHVLHLISFLLETQPVQVVGVEAHHGGVTDVVDYVNCMAKLPDGVEASLWYGKTLLGQRNGLRVRVFGEEGSAEWVQTDPEFLRMADSRARIKLIDRATTAIEVANSSRYDRFKAGHPAGFLEAFANLYSDLGDALTLYSTSHTMDFEYVWGADEAAQGLSVLEAIHESALNQKWCQVAIN